MGLLNDIRQHLINLGVVEGSTGWKCWIGYLPDDQDKAVGVFATGGFAADTLGRENELPTFQARIRTGKFEYGACEAQWRQVFDALQDAGPGGSFPDPLVGYALIQALATGPATWLDEKLRPNFTSNFRVVKARS